MYHEENMQEVILIKENYLAEKRLTTFPVVSNLNDYLDDLVVDRKSIIVIDNFQQVNMMEFHIPVILRNPVPFVRRVSFGRDITHDTILASSSTNSSYLSQLQYQTERSCPISNFFTGYSIGHWNDVCIRINLRKYFPYAKPFNIPIHLGIFPPDYLKLLGIRFQEFLRTKLFYFKFKYLKYWLTTLSSIPLVHAIVDHRYQFWLESRNSLKWIKDTIPERNYDVLHTAHNVVFLLFHNLQIKKPELPGLEYTGYIESLHVLQVCPTCVQTALRNTFGTVIIKHVRYHDIRSLSKISIQISNDLVWDLNELKFAGNVFALAMTNVACQNVKLTNQSVEDLKEEVLLQQVAMEHSKVFEAILGNATFVNRHNFDKCARETNGNFEFYISIKQHPYKKTTYKFPYYSQEFLGSLRIVGCGSQGLSSVAFGELISVFDKSTWVFTVLMVVGTSIILRLLVKGTSLEQNGISVLKILLEQGDPFQESAFEKVALRVFIVLLLLMGIILSNAYKSTNIYNMVVPRQPIPYKYYRELIRDGFKIHSRSAFIFLEDSVSLTENSPYELLDIYFNEKGVAVVTEFQLFLVQIKLGTINQAENKNNKIQYLQKYVKLNPKVKKEFRKRVQRQMSNASRHSTNSVIGQLIDSGYSDLQKIEMSIMKGSLIRCDKTAVILPDFIGRDWKTELWKHRHISNVFLGVETFLETDWMYSFKGLMSTQVTKRFHQIAESGVWKWWIGLLAKDNINFFTSGNVNAAEMSGNVVIVFAVWGCGLGFSLLCVVLEYFYTDVHEKFEIFCSHFVLYLTGSV